MKKSPLPSAVCACMFVFVDACKFMLECLYENVPYSVKNNFLGCLEFKAESIHLQCATRLPLFLQCQNMGTLEDIYVAYVDSDGDEVMPLVYILIVLICAYFTSAVKFVGIYSYIMKWY